MIDWVRVGLSVIAIVSCLGISYIGFRLFSFFKGSKFETPFKIMVPLPLVLAAAEFVIISEEFTGMGFLKVIRIVLEVLFVVLVLYTVNLYYEDWIKISSMPE